MINLKKTLFSLIMINSNNINSSNYFTKCYNYFSRLIFGEDKNQDKIKKIDNNLEKKNLNEEKDNFNLKLEEETSQEKIKKENDKMKEEYDKILDKLSHLIYKDEVKEEEKLTTRINNRNRKSNKKKENKEINKVSENLSFILPEKETISHEEKKVTLEAMEIEEKFTKQYYINRKNERKEKQKQEIILEEKISKRKANEFQNLKMSEEEQKNYKKENEEKFEILKYSDSDEELTNCSDEEFEVLK